MPAAPAAANSRREIMVRNSLVLFGAGAKARRFSLPRECRQSSRLLRGTESYQATFGNSFDLIMPIFARRNVRATDRQPRPYLTLRRKLMDEASGKYLVGQLTSAMV